MPRAGGRGLRLNTGPDGAAAQALAPAFANALAPATLNAIVVTPWSLLALTPPPCMVATALTIAMAIGAWSYAIYLLHNRVGVSLTYNIGQISPEWARQSVLIPLVVGIFVITTSMLVFRYWEAPARNFLRRFAR